MTATRSSAAASVGVHLVMAALVLAAPRAALRGPPRRPIAIELETVRRTAPSPEPARERAAAPVPPASRPPDDAPTPPVLPAPRPPAAPSPPRRVAVAPRPQRPAVARATPRPVNVREPRPAPPPRSAPRAVESPPTDAPPPRTVEPARTEEVTPPSPPRLALFDRGALAAAIAPVQTPRATPGTTTRGEVDEGEADAPAVDGVRSITEELREQALAGRPEAQGVVTYFGDVRRRMAGNWAPRTVHLPSRTKAMIQSMQAMNRAALDMMEGRSKRAQRAQEDGRITPDEWRDAMREAAQKARAVTSVIIAVVHDANGQVVDIEVTRSSGHDEFDREVIAAARETLAHEPSPPMPADPTLGTPAGRVARYRFDVLMTTMPPVPPMVGVTFDESTGYFRVFYPGEINWRLNVVFLGARRGMELRPQSRESTE